MLYIFDPDAMHNIIVKDQYIYEEAAFFIKCVQLYLRYALRDLTVPRSHLLHFGPGLLGTLGKSYGIPNTRLPKLISAQAITTGSNARCSIPSSPELTCAT